MSDVRGEDGRHQVFRALGSYSRATLPIPNRVEIEEGSSLKIEFSFGDQSISQEVDWNDVADGDVVDEIVFAMLQSVKSGGGA